MYGIRSGEAGGLPAMLTEHASRPGFRLAVAFDEDDMVGFAYGFTGEAGQQWRDQMARALDDLAADDWLNGLFEFAEFGVVPDRRRRGIGTRLYDDVFDGLLNERAVLTVRDHNTPALAFYPNRGWVPLGDGFVANAGHGPYVIMGKVLI